MKNKIPFNTLLKFLLLICYIAIGDDSFCQQIPLYNQYYINQFLYNPAMTGSENQSKLFLIHKSQWASISGMPVNNSITFDSPVKNKVGLGFSIYNEKRGLNSRTATHGYYAYKIRISDQSKLLFGLSLGLVSDRMDVSKAIVQNQSDPYLLNAPQRNTTFDSKAGLMFIFKKLELGLSALQLTGNVLQKSSYETFANMDRHFYISSKYTFILNQEKNISLYPLILAKVNSKNFFQYDINTVVNWQNKGWASISYKSNYAISISAGLILIKRLNIGYSYDIVTNSLRSYGGLSHEITIGYLFPDAKTRRYQKEIQEISRKLKKRGDLIIDQLQKCLEQKEKSNNKEEIEKIDQEIEKFKEELEKMKNIIEKKPVY